MAREDTRWFAVAVVILSLVLFLALPLAALVAIEARKTQAEVRSELRELRGLKKEIKEANAKKPTASE
jgi:hypothetical protein